MSINRFIDTLDTKIDKRLPQSAEAIRKRKNRLIRPVATLALAAGAVGVGFGIDAFNEADKAPTFSEETTTYTLQQGESEWDASDIIEGIDTIDVRDAVNHIKAMDENQAALEDGLQAYEQLTVPQSVVQDESK